MSKKKKVPVWASPLDKIVLCILKVQDFTEYSTFSDCHDEVDFPHYYVCGQVVEETEDRVRVKALIQDLDEAEEQPQKERAFLIPKGSVLSWYTLKLDKKIIDKEEDD